MWTTHTINQTFKNINSAYLYVKYVLRILKTKIFQTKNITCFLIFLENTKTVLSYSEEKKSYIINSERPMVYAPQSIFFLIKLIN